MKSVGVCFPIVQIMKWGLKVGQVAEPMSQNRCSHCSKKWAEALWCKLTITSCTRIILWVDWWILLLPMIITRAAVTWGCDWISFFPGRKIALAVAQEASWTRQPENLSSSPCGVFMRHKLRTGRWLGSKKQKLEGVRVLASWAAASFLSYSISQSQLMLM